MDAMTTCLTIMLIRRDRDDDMAGVRSRFYSGVVVAVVVVVLLVSV